MKFHVEGWFEGDIEADSAADAEANFMESDIENIDINAVWAIEDEYEAVWAIEDEYEAVQ